MHWDQLLNRFLVTLLVRPAAGFNHEDQRRSLVILIALDIANSITRCHMPKKRSVTYNRGKTTPGPQRAATDSKKARLTAVPAQASTNRLQVTWTWRILLLLFKPFSLLIRPKTVDSLHFNYVQNIKLRHDFRWKKLLYWTFSRLSTFYNKFIWNSQKYFIYKKYAMILINLSQILQLSSQKKQYRTDPKRAIKKIKHEHGIKWKKTTVFNKF